MNDILDTRYTKLNKILTRNSGLVQPEMDGSFILKGKTPDDIYKQYQELKQTKFLSNQYFSIEKSHLQQVMHYEAQRIHAFTDYEGMEYYPLIASALDLYMEESTVIGDNGKMLNIYSKSPRIKSILEELFYDTLNINVNLPSWARNLVKYGDNFLYLNIQSGKGITMAKQMLNMTIERKEEIRDNKLRVYFKKRDSAQEMSRIEVAHFRLLGDDKYLPYGSSILNKIRKYWRMLILAEDAMLSYRIIRAGDKWVYNVDVGNMATEDILPYVEDFAKSVKRKPVINPNNANIDYRFNIIGNDEDIFMPRRNGNTGTSVERLEGSNSFDKINDIEYLRDLLFTGLGIPKPFLGYQQTAGDGKNVTQLDMRFSKKVNRIQQALIQELTNMAMVHLYLLGFEDEFDNFSLSLSPPSTQADILKIELMQQKIQLYNDMTLPSDNGISATSHTYAKQYVFNWSEEEIIRDLEKQFMERIVIQEIQNATNNVAKSGIFEDLLKKYGLKTGEIPIGAVQSPDGEGGEGGSDPFAESGSIDSLTEPSGNNEPKQESFIKDIKSKSEIKKDLLKESAKKLNKKTEKLIIDILNKD